jgi:hypothetical protein
MSSSYAAPDDFAVACIEGEWYPLEVQRLYSSAHPDGSIWLSPFYDLDGNDVHYHTKKKAMFACEQQALFNRMVECERWERLVEDVEGYPERRAWYLSLIEQARGSTPLITRGVDGYSLYILGYACPDCERWMTSVTVFGPTLDDVLARATERVYATRCVCERAQEQRLQDIA